MSTLKGRNSHKKRTSAKSMKTNTLPKLSSKNVQLKLKLSFDQSWNIPLKNQQALMPIPSKLCCKLKTCNDVRFKIKSPRLLNQQNPTSTLPLLQVIHKLRGGDYPRIVSSSKLEAIFQSFVRDQVITTLGTTTYTPTSNLKTESEENCKQRFVTLQIHQYKSTLYMCSRLIRYRIFMFTNLACPVGHLCFSSLSSNPQEAHMASRKDQVVPQPTGKTRTSLPQVVALWAS